MKMIRVLSGGPFIYHFKIDDSTLDLSLLIVHHYTTIMFSIILSYPMLCNGDPYPPSSKQIWRKWQLAYSMDKTAPPPKPFGMLYNIHIYLEVTNMCILAWELFPLSNKQELRKWLIKHSTYAFYLS